MSATFSAPNRLIRKFELLPPSSIRQQEIGLHSNSVGAPSNNTNPLSHYEFARSNFTFGDSVLNAVAKKQIEKALAFIKPDIAFGGFFTSDDPETLKRGFSTMFQATREIALEAQAHGLSKIFNRQKDTQKKILCAPTSRIEDHPISDEGLKMLIKHLVNAENGLGRQKLINAVQNGPEDGKIAFSPAKDIYEAIGGIVRWLAISPETKFRFRYSQELRQEMWAILDAEGYERKVPMVGGVAAFCSQLLAAQGHDPIMYNEGHMIQEFGEHFAPEFKVFSDNNAIETMGQLLAEDSKSSPGHFSISLSSNDILSELGSLRIRYTRESLEHGDEETIFKDFDANQFKCGERDLIVSGAQFPVGFSDSVEDRRLTKLSREIDLALLSGFQYATTKEEYDRYFRGVKLLSEGNAPVVVEYSEPKCVGSEIELYGLMQLRMHNISAIAFNTTEAKDLLIRLNEFRDQSLTDEGAQYLDKLGLSEQFWRDLENVLARFLTTSEIEKAKQANTPWSDATEDSIWLYDAARIIHQITNIPWIRVRGKFADVTVVDSIAGIEEPEKVRASLTFSRQQAALKSATESGNIRDVNDEYLLEVVPCGESLASNIRLGNKISSKEVMTLGITEKLARDWYLKLPNDEYVFLAIPHRFMVRKNTVSAGDTMAATAWSGLTDQLKKTHRHLTGAVLKEGPPPEIWVG